VKLEELVELAHDWEQMFGKPPRAIKMNQHTRYELMSRLFPIQEESPLGSMTFSGLSVIIDDSVPDGRYRIV
jgi:hypothetical protein